MSGTAMTGAYISGGELHISLDSASYNGYCDYLRGKLKELEDQKKSIEESIIEIHKILNPPTIIIDCDDDESEGSGEEVNEDDMYMFDLIHKPEHLRMTKKEEVHINGNTGTVTLTVKDIPEASPKEKYLLVSDIARKYKTTEACVIEQCGKGNIPCHRVGVEYRFTPSDCERLSSLIARRQVFTPAPNPTPAPAAKTTVANGSGRTMSATKAYELLDISWYGAQKLRTAGLLTGKKDGDGQFWYDEKEVLALRDLIKEKGGIANLLQNLSNPEGMLTCADIRKMLECTSSDYDSLKKLGYLKGTQKGGGRAQGSYCLFPKTEVEALADMVKAEGGIKPFLAKARAI